MSSNGLVSLSIGGAFAAISIGFGLLALAPSMSWAIPPMEATARISDFFFSQAGIY